MKKLFYLLGLATLFLVASCNNDDLTESIQETKMYSPTVKGIFAEFTDANPAPRAGVIEDNEDFRLGEKFYWHNGDEVLLAFYPGGDIGATPITLTYTAQVAGDEKPKNAEFTTTGSVPAGNYTVYGFYPASSWTAEADGTITAAMVTPAPIAQGQSSAYLGQNMFMKAKAENVVVGDEEPNSIDLSYKHLGGVIRFHIRNSDETLRLEQLVFGKMNAANEGVPFFATVGSLADVDAEALSLVPTSLQPLASVVIADGSNGLDFDFFLPFLPIEGFQPSERLVLQATFEGALPLTLELNTTDFAVLEQGFEAGNSYYFSLTNWVAN